MTRDTHIDPFDAQGRPQGSYREYLMSNDEHENAHEPDQMTVMTEVTITATHGEETRTITLRCGDIDSSTGTLRALVNENHTWIDGPDNVFALFFKHAEVVRQVYTNRVTGESTATEGPSPDERLPQEEDKFREQHEQRTRVRDPYQQGYNFDPQMYYYGQYRR